MSPPNPNLRLGVLGVVVVSLFAALFGRLWFLQGLSSPELAAVATENRERVVPIDPVRGRILDRQGRVLAENRASNVVTVERTGLRNATARAELFDRLEGVLGVAADEMEARYCGSIVGGNGCRPDARANGLSPLLPLPVASDVGEDLAVLLAERAEEFPGVEVRATSVRVYPYGTVAAHVLGYVGPISEAEWSDREARGYQLDDVVGKAGVEKSFEDDLRGTPGRVTFLVDAQGRVIGEKERVEPVPGDDVQLTIDLNVQVTAEQALLAGLLDARNKHPKDHPDHPFEAPAGAVVVTDPDNGSVIAMASYPTYDPREFIEGVSTERYQQLLTEGRFTNRAIGGQYAPGSTFKVVPAWAAVQAGLRTPGELVYDPGYYDVPNCTAEEEAGCRFYNAGKVPHGYVNLTEAITVSSDVYFYGVGAEFWRQQDTYGVDALQKMAAALGLGADTGIALPDETAGRVPTPQQKKELHESNPQAFPYGDWFTGDNTNLAIGQGDALVTPLQLANLYGTVANGGGVLAPNIAFRVLEAGTADGDGAVVVREIGTRVVRQVQYDEGLRQAFTDGLIGVLIGNGGTARKAFDGYPWYDHPIAGKTGTAQTGAKEPWNDTSLFVSYGPVDSPQYVVAVVMEKSGFGSAAAAPTARKLWEVLFGIVEPPAVELAPPLGEVAELSAFATPPTATEAADAVGD